jgi:YD repeat-containing protein
MRRPVLSLIAFVILLSVVFGTSTRALAAAPVIQILDPHQVSIGGLLIIGGTGFGSTQGSSTITFNGTPVTIIESWSATGINAEVPLGATTGNVIVRVGGANSNGWHVTIIPAPAITNVSPSSGPIGTPITITGTNLDPFSAGGGAAIWQALFFPAGGCSPCWAGADPVHSSDTLTTANVPAAATTGKIAVLWSGITGTPGSFTVTGTLAPVAAPGTGFNQYDVVPLGSTVRLDGTHSYDLNGLPLTYQWSLYSVPTGSHAVLLNPTSPLSTFVADVVGEYVAQVIVNNGTLSSSPLLVIIDTSTAANNYPISNAGPDQTVNVGSTVQLDGSGSINAAGDPLNYIWCLWYAANDSSAMTYQGMASFSNPYAVNPTFVASNAGSYFAKLSVGSNGGCSFTGSGRNGAAPNYDFVKISTLNTQPLGNAGPAQSIQAPQTVQLDGTGSTDVDGNALTYSWAIVSKPTGSTAALSSSTYPQPTFYADIVGTYVAQLIVNDGTVNSLPGLSGDPIVRTSTVTITNLDVTPVANAGPAQTVSAGNPVNLDGTASSDVDGHSLSYRWSLLSSPPNSTASLSLPTSENPYFTTDVAGKYVVQLIVNDTVVDSVPTTVEISTDNSRPVAGPGPHQIVATGSTVQLSGADSNDADGNSLSYQWAILYQPSGSHAVLSSATAVDPTFVAGTAGLYVVQLIVNDGQLNSSPVTTWIKAQANQAPVVSAGQNQTITLPTNLVTLFGTATDDGLPNGTLAISWTQVSGPGTTTFSSPTTPITDATFPLAGVYVLKLTANDSQLSGSATVTVTVNAGVVVASLSAVQTETVVITGFIGPWSLSGGLNSSYVYGNSGTSPPVTFPVVAGEQVSLRYISGTVSIREVLGLNYDAKGCTDSGACPFPAGVNYSAPAFYGSQYQNPGSLIGAWADATGQLITRPFAVNDGATVTGPSGAALLQLGVNDIYYNDNGCGSTGCWTIQIQAGVPVLGVGPNVTGTSQTVDVYVTLGGVPVVNGSVQFTVAGANASTSTQSTNSYGVATFTYTGANQGTDTVQATYGTYATNTVTISWVTPVNTITTTAALGKFFVGDGSCTFDTVPTATLAFSQSFPGITFNPPANFVPGNTTITDFTVPFTDVTTDKNGNFTGAIVAQGNGYQAGAGAMSTAFQAEFSGSFVVSASGNIILNTIDDGGFILGIGGGATRISGILVGAPASTPFQHLTVVGAYNQAVTNGPANYNVTVYFPSAGTYPFELDYTVCNGSPIVPMTMVMGTGSSGSGVPTPSAGSLALTPTNPPPIQVNNTQIFTVLAVDGSGAPIPNLSILSNIYGANQVYLSGTTNASGQATLSYVGTQAGVDQVQAFSNVDSSVGVSNVVPVTWTGTLNTTYIFTPQGWISSPLIGAVVQNQVPITLASGVTLTSGTLKFFPSSNTSQVTVLNSNTTGTGPLTLGTFDATLLANGEYTIQLQATSSTGASQLNEIVVSVTGSYKPGREVVTVTDFKVPLAGIPISVSRNYDTLNRGNVAAFGNGWSFGSDVNLQVDLLLNVTFTFNGNPETFYFTPQSAGQGLFPWLVLPDYTPQPGVHGTLTSNGCNMLIYAGGVLVQDQSGVVCFLGGTYRPTLYTYTDPAGRAYTMACTGANCTTTPPIFELQTIKDLNGNTLTFSSGGITSSAGVNVTFYRDAQNRITKITDPNQNNYLYSYDSPCGTGNLCSVTFPGTITIQANYTYFSDHSLNMQSDPNSNTTTYTYYSANTQNCVSCIGRLQNVTGPMVAGPNGTQTQYVTQYAYNVATNTTTTTYPDGGIVNETDDSFGNPVTIVDALNNTTTFMYYPNETLHTKVDPLRNPPTTYAHDANGFVTSLTDPLNHVTTWTYNQYGGLASTTDAVLQNTTTIGYDAFFNPNTSSDSLSHTFGPLYTRTFDSMGNILTQTDANGNASQFTYDSRGNVLKVVDPLNEVTTFTYDNMDRVLSQTGPRQNQTVYGYDALGNLTDLTDAVGHVRRSTYDLNGNKTSDVDPLGRTTSYVYDALNRLVKVTYPDQTTKQYTSYDFRNNKLSETDQLGRVNQYVYYLDGHLKSVTYALGTPDAGTVQYTYDADGNTKTITDEDNNQTTYNYDAANRLKSIQDAAPGGLTQYFYDADNRRTSMIDANNNPATTYGYDLRSRLQTVTYPDTPATKDQYTYDGVGNQLTFTDQALNKTTRKYDVVNRLLSVTDALTPAGVTKYAYDPAGNLLSITDADSHVTSFQYDNLNHRVLRALPLGMVETFAYDAMGNISAKTDFNSKTTNYAYDKLNRLLTKTPDPSFSEPTISFTYFPTGTRQTLVDATGTTNYTYDNRDRLKIKATPEGTLNYTHDAHGNLLTILSSNTNGASVTYTPDALNRVGTVVDNRLLAQGVSSATTTYTYFPVGTVQNYTYSTNAVQTAYTYDTLNRLKTIGSTKGSTGLSSFT